MDVSLEKGHRERRSEFDPAVVREDNHCYFGKWLYSDRFRHIVPKRRRYLPELKTCMRNFTWSAGRILELALRGNKRWTLRSMGTGSEFLKISGQVDCLS